MLRLQAARPPKRHEFRPEGGPYSRTDGRQGEIREKVNGGRPVSRHVALVRHKARYGTDMTAIGRHSLRNPVSVHWSVCHVGPDSGCLPAIPTCELGKRHAVSMTVCLGMTPRPRDFGANGLVCLAAAATRGAKGLLQLRRSTAANGAPAGGHDAATASARCRRYEISHAS